jgi:hypothetical protein
VTSLTSTPRPASSARAASISSTTSCVPVAVPGSESMTPLADGDRARRAGRGQLDEAQVLAVSWRHGSIATRGASAHAWPTEPVRPTRRSWSGRSPPTRGLVGLSGTPAHWRSSTNDTVDSAERSCAVSVSICSSAAAVAAGLLSSSPWSSRCEGSNKG